ncbi:hypothetical protein [Pseudomonas sp. NBRC 111140]|uniref:hypothetical protein n=1 Tax=Pseudomonas sp. NBRC 111140 TaxID=1661055 RepID=UPI0007613CCB|nr:hypothetical protein [Pseudomonas sp. NBRC 111140]
MHIFEVVVPGVWLDYEDQEWVENVEPLLRMMESQFIDANLALNLFENSEREYLRRPSREDRDLQWKRRFEIRQAVEAEQIGAANYDAQAVALESEVRFKRERWAAGQQPREFQHHTSLLYARAFLYALDGFDKALKVLAKTPDVPMDAAEQFKRMGEKFPCLRGVRNTAQHLEDRIRGLGEPAGRGKPCPPLDLQPMENEIAHAPAGGVLFTNCLSGSNYGSTMADGHYGQVDVSPVSMEALSEILHAVLNAFAWTGPKRHLPSA